MARFRVSCGGCGFNEVFDDEVPPEDVSAEEWDAETAAEEARDNHQLSEGHSVHIERIE
jgi:hypothetical protein